MIEKKTVPSKPLGACVLFVLVGVVGPSLTAACEQTEAQLAPDGGSVGGSQQANQTTEPAYAVHLRSDDAAAIALLDAEGEIFDPRFLHSGSLPSGLNQLLGDIALPTHSGAPGVLAVVARSPQDSVLRVSLENGTIQNQFSTQVPGGDTAYSSNPQDYLYLDAHTAWVTRYAPNPDPNALEMNLGDDLIKVDPSDGSLLGRVDLSAFHETIDYDLVDRATGDSTKVRGTAYARPSSLVRLGQHVVIGLSRLTLDFSGQAAGAVGVLDLATETVEPFELSGLGNCGNVLAVVGRPDAAIVSCVGVPWGSAESAGVVLLSVDSQGDVQIEATFRPQDGPLAVFFPISLGGSQVVVAESGWATGEVDRLFRLNLTTGELSEFFAASGAGIVGFSGAYSQESRLLLVGDRSEGATGVRRFRVGDVLRELPMVPFDSSLPVDGLRSLVR